MSTKPWFVTDDMLDFVDWLSLSNQLHNAVKLICTEYPHLTAMEVIELLMYWRSLQ